jgi:hypothetical protein
MKTTEKTFNVITGEETISEREMTPEEIERYNLETERIAESKVQAEIIATQKAALLAKLGITADEAALLLGEN